MKNPRLSILMIALIGCTVYFMTTGNFRPVVIANSDEYNTLTAAEAKILLREGTERAFSGEYHNSKEEGLYICKLCDRPLFDSVSKFDSKSGWPSFDDFLPGAIVEKPDGGRTEIECANCGGHIGHVFRGEMFTAKDTRHCANSLALNFVAKANEERGIFAGGCFWGVEHHLERIPGVLTVISGYVGGTVPNPTYQNVLSKRTGHAEAVEVIYDSSKVSYEKIAKMFFEIHDPTQVDRQGPDIGEQYRSEVFYVNDEQKATAEKLIDILKSKGMNVATKVTLAGTFWPAEDYHQDYYAVTGKEPYCHSWTQRFDDDEEVM
jgi:peptide methionine sulfoxide reductase msrA/msrB